MNSAVTQNLIYKDWEPHAIMPAGSTDAQTDATVKLLGDEDKWVASWTWGPIPVCIPAQ